VLWLPCMDYDADDDDDVGSLIFLEDVLEEVTAYEEAALLKGKVRIIRSSKRSIRVYE